MEKLMTLFLFCSTLWYVLIIMSKQWPQVYLPNFLHNLSILERNFFGTHLFWDVFTYSQYLNEKTVKKFPIILRGRQE